MVAIRIVCTNVFVQGVSPRGRGRGTASRSPARPHAPSLNDLCYRFVLAATEHLHKRIAKMKDRIRQLEDALAILHAKGSNDPHPLLRDDLVSVDNAEPEVDDEKVTSQPPVSTATLIDSFGTLSVSEHGI